MLILICLAASSILLGACNQSDAAPVQANESAGELRCSGSELTYEFAGRVAGRWTVADPRPYQIISQGQPALVSTMDDQLQVTTWAVGPAIQRYPGMFPATVQPTLTALAALPSQDEALALDTRLLGGDGRTIWSAANALLLTPEVRRGVLDTAYCAEAGAVDEETDLMLPFGERPRLLAVDGVSGELLWATALNVDSPVADVQLTALTASHGLLTLQYNFYRYEFMVFARDTGAITALHRLAGMPATRVVYPGAFDELVLLELADGEVSLAVFLAAGDAQIWSIRLADGRLATSPYSPGRAVREENDLPIGGTGAPGPGAVVFPQKILPVAAGPDWRCPALVDEQGRVLVIDGDQAGWRTAAPGEEPPAAAR